MSSFNSDIWYSFGHTTSNGQFSLGRNPDAQHPTAVYLYPTNISDPTQQWQILTAPGLPSSDAFILIRGSNLPAVFYLHIYCGDLEDCLGWTLSGLTVREVANEASEEEDMQWDVHSTGIEGEFYLTNRANGTQFGLAASNTTILIEESLDVWTISAISAINDARYSSTLTATLATSTDSTTASSPATTTPADLTTTASGGSPTASIADAAPSGGLSGGAKGGIAAAVCAAVIIGTILWLFARRYRRQRREQNNNTSPSQYTDPDRGGVKELHETYKKPYLELAGQQRNQSHEMDSDTNVRARGSELEANHAGYRSELPGNLEPR